jgi:glycolate oxidase subunit GlcD
MASSAPQLDAAVDRALRELLGERLLTDAAARLVYECDALAHFRRRPRAVALPENTEEVAAIMRIASAANIPITPRGAGTGLSGGATPPEEGGIVLDTSAMRALLEIDPIDRIARVQPGLVNARLSEAAAPLGLHYAPDPSSQAVCTLGGNYGENASGPHGLKHGPTARHVLGATVVLEDGQILELGGRAGTEGLDLVGLICGSEGTLAVTTELILRLTPLPECTSTLLASFPSLPLACRAVSAIVAAGIECAALEALDDRTIAAVEASVFAAGYPREAAAVLLVELDGQEEEVAADRDAILGILRACEALDVEAADDPERRAALWRGRKGAFGAMGRVAPNIYVMDAVVPRSKLELAIRRIGEICDAADLRLANVFHAGEGNLHPNISYDGRDAEEVERVLRANEEIVRCCLDLGGTLSGEHGIGLEKSAFMPWIYSEDELALFRSLRESFGPKSILNPDKILPTPRACTEVKGPLAQAPELRR